MSTCQIVNITTLSKHLIGITLAEAVSLASDQNTARTHEKEGDTIWTGKDLDIGDKLMKKVSNSSAAYQIFLG